MHFLLDDWHVCVWLERRPWVGHFCLLWVVCLGAGEEGQCGTVHTRWGVGVLGLGLDQMVTVAMLACFPPPSLAHTRLVLPRSLPCCSTSGSLETRLQLWCAMSLTPWIWTWTAAVRLRGPLLPERPLLYPPPVHAHPAPCAPPMLLQLASRSSQSTLSATRSLWSVWSVPLQ
jgi:hypothetical protein